MNANVKEFLEIHADFEKMSLQINKQVYLLSNDSDLQEVLITQLGPENLQISVFTELEKLTASCKKTTPTAILVDQQTDTSKPDIETIAALQKTLAPCPPIFCISTANDLASRLAAAQAGSTRFFSKPVEIGKLFRALRSFSAIEKDKAYRVLHIDDDQTFLSLVETHLQRAGIEVKTCTDAEQGLELLSQFQPDLLLLDVQMPRISGSELKQAIRQDDDFAQLPIIHVSMEDSPQHLEALKLLNGDDFFSKKKDLSLLVTRIKKRIKRSRESKRTNLGLQEALLNSELRRCALDNHAIVSTTDASGKITYVNDTFCKISGYERNELLGKNHRILKSGMHPAEFYSEMWQTISQGETWQGSICNRAKSGEEYWVESTIVPFLDKNGLPYQYISIRTDITELRAHEERLHRSQVFANIGTWDWNIETGNLIWSERIGHLFGYNDAVPETTYENFLAAVHPEDRERLIDAVNRCVEKGDEYNIEHRVVWPDGSIHWVQERGDVVRNEQGTPLHMLGVITDITLRKEAENELLKHKAAMDGSQEGISIIGKSGKYRYANHALATIYGYDSAEKLIGQYWNKHYSADELLNFDEQAMKKLVCSLHWNGETVGIRKDGSHFPQMLSLSTLKDGDLVCVTQDISARKQVEAELIKAKETAEQASKAKSQFLSNMSHELRTPMNAIIGFGQLLKLDDLNESQQDNVEEILKASHHLLELINDVLDLSRVEANKLDLNIEDISLCDVLDECLNLITPLADQKQIQVITTRDGEPIDIGKKEKTGVIFTADRIRLKQALINLLSNAIKYNTESGKVSIDTHKISDDRLRISVTDTGPGIPASQQSQLFKPFNRLGAENSEIEGTGIGLVYTQKIIEMMNGSVGAESTPGEGSTFWIELPGHFGTEEKKDITSQETQITNSTEHDSKIFKMLYVEDNPTNMHLMKRMLERRPNIELIQAENPFTGLELATQHQPDLIMLDINLPGISGYELLQILRESSDLKSIPVIAVSANAMPADIQKGLSAGFNRYITKPIHMKELFSTLDEILHAKPAEVEEQQYAT